MSSAVPLTRIAIFRARDGCEVWASRAQCDWVSEEIYAVSGSGLLKVDERSFELRTLDAVRVAPASTREFEAGPDGLEVLAFGLHSSGDGEMVQPKT